MSARWFVVTILAFMLSGFLVTSYAQEITVTNVSYAMKDSDVVVRYSLDGPAGRPYKVLLVLRRETQPFFRMLPIDVTGDVGSDERPGQNRQIVWHLYRDVPYGLDGDDYYFEVSATLIGKKNAGASWLYYLGGVIVGGAAAIYIGPTIFNKPGGSVRLPTPPVRP